MQKQREQIAKTEELITFNFWHFVMISQPNNNFIGMCNVTCQAFSSLLVQINCRIQKLCQGKNT